jgi:hypothetical protein
MMKMFLAALLLLAGAASHAAAGAKHALIICGHPGDDSYREQFVTSIDQLVTGLTTKLAFETGRVRVLFGSEAMAGDDGPRPAQLNGPGSAAAITQAAAELAATATAEDTVWVIVLGHAYFDGRNCWLNLPGDDLPESQFAQAFAGLQASDSVFWMTTAASGFFLKPLAVEGRILISATEADREVQATLMAEELAGLLSEPPTAADLDADQDQSLTLLDLYLTLAQRIGRRYVDGMLIITEHAQLDDNADGRCTEVQRTFLPRELDGTRDEGEAFDPPAEGRDGWHAARRPLEIQVAPPIDLRPPSPAEVIPASQS